MMKPYFAEDSKADFRVVVLTDGQNNAGLDPSDALYAANSIGAMVDAIIVGDRPDSNLRKIVNASGGECWQINDLGEGFELLEAESVVSLQARRNGAEKPAFKPRLRVALESLQEKMLTKSSQVKRSAGLAAELASKTVKSLSATVAGDASQLAIGSRPPASVRRLMMELKKVNDGVQDVWGTSSSGAGAGIHIFPTEDALDSWRALIEGPQDSPFEGGIFVVNIKIPNEYPLKAPSISFETPIYHCNVNDSGSICLDILKDNWSPSITIPAVLQAIRQMIAEPNSDDSLRQWIAELTLAHKASKGADTRYYDNAREATKRDASTTVEEWKQRWGCR
mmetsp:Transcript_13476/g.20473  ORF Transcript_13476/g.20473 Transcript_13476/m.20473 type:complete len:337 (+) Transcript_13476:1-1011(+)